MTFPDAINIEEGKIIVDGSQWGFVSGVTVDGRRPEEFVNVIGGQIRRQKPEETDWSVDAVTLYDNLQALKALKNVLFDIVIIVSNPDVNAPNTNKTQTLTIRGCRISDENISINAGSSFKISGKASEWTITPGS